MSVANNENSDAVNIKPVTEGGFLVSGALTFETVPSAWRTCSTLLSGGGDIMFDLQGVSHTDSAGLALLIECTRIARAREKHITFKNIPAQMLAIATMSGVERILPIVGE